MITALFAGQMTAQGKGKAKATKTAPVATDVVYKSDKEATTVAWFGKKVGGAHNGKIKLQDGFVTMTGDNIKAGNIVIDMSSISCDDIADAGNNGNLVGHLKNEDFFNVVAFPHAIFDITKSVKLGKGKHRVTGNLTIKGITLPTTFDLNIAVVEGKLTAKGKITFDRTKYDIKYGSGLIGTAKDKMIMDDVVLQINLIATSN